MSIVLVVVEHAADGLPRTSREACTLARGLAEDLAGTGGNGSASLEAAVLGPLSEDARTQLCDLGVARIHVLEHDRLDADATPSAWADALARLIDQEPGVAAAVGPASERVSPVLAHLAARTDLPLAANCTAITPDDDGWELTRVRWGGMLYEDAHLDAEVALVSVAAHQTVATVASTPGAGEVVVHTPDLGDGADATRVVDREAREGGVGLATARLVVSGGRGVGSAEGFAVLEELAELLGGAVGCSRVATNAGWRSHNDQVGQTGTRVAPDLYIACGISGATQHWVGCMNAKRILAINTDADAPMVTRANEAVIGDLHDLLPALIDEIRARRAE